MRLVRKTFLRVALVVALSTLHCLRASAQTCSAAIQRVLLTNAAANPVEIRNAGDDRLFIVEQAGKIRILENGALRTTPFLDLTASVEFGGERGLVTLAFHPSYPTVPWFFVYYTNKNPALSSVGDVVLARYSVSADPNVADPSSGRVLLVVPHSLASNHNGGQLQFSPSDGYLYVSIGDGGGGCDNTASGCNAQRDDTLLGKILRIDVDRDTPPYYGIPSTNPFAAAGPPRDEIWAKGVRNPFRISFDRANGNLWIADVGQGAREEIDMQPSGAAGGRNYGWPVMEGTACGTCSTSSCPAPIVACNASALTLPAHEYDHSVGNVVIGGYVYRGTAVPGLVGCYLFADNANGHSIWAIDPASPSVRRTLDGTVNGVTTFGEDKNGELYVAATGGIYRIVRAPAAVPAASPTFAALLGLALFGAASTFVRMSAEWRRRP